VNIKFTESVYTKQPRTNIFDASKNLILEEKEQSESGSNTTPLKDTEQET